MKNKFKLSVLAFAIIAVASGCQKMERPKLGDYPKDIYDPNGPLRFYVPFDGGTPTDPLLKVVDSVMLTPAATNPLNLVPGIRGTAIQGERDKAIKYSSANLFRKATSITIAFWVKHVPTAGGPEFYFSLFDNGASGSWEKSSVFMLIEDQGQSDATAVTLKFVIQDHWYEFTGANKFNKPLLNGQWHHLAFVYDETTGKITYYFDGEALSGLPANLTDANLGKLQLKGGGSFVVGGWNKHVGLEGSTDSWINSYSGQMDQFRLYGKALTASEVQALFNSKQ